MQIQEQVTRSVHKSGWRICKSGWWRYPCRHSWWETVTEFVDQLVPHRDVGALSASVGKPAYLRTSSDGKHATGYFDFDLPSDWPAIFDKAETCIQSRNDPDDPLYDEAKYDPCCHDETVDVATNNCDMR